eukprot:977472-Prorocentrum_lima.AAC.1
MSPCRKRIACWHRPEAQRRGRRHSGGQALNKPRLPYCTAQAKGFTREPNSPKAAALGPSPFR